MMRNIHIICFCLLAHLLYSQIPNGGFESWEQVNDYEVPSLWETNQDTLFERVTKDDFSIEGDYALKFHANAGSAWFDCGSRANLNHKFDQAIGENKSFFFYLKAIPADSLNSTHFLFYCQPFANGVQQTDIEWYSTQQYPDYTLIEIPIFDAEIDSIHLQVASGGLNGPADGCHAQTIAWMDGLTIENRTTEVNNISISDINIFPNPTPGKFAITQGDDTYHQYLIFNNIGQEIQRGKLPISEITIKDEGIYLIHLISDLPSKKAITRKIIVAR